MDRRLVLGKVNYQAYGLSVGGKTYDGRPIPKWEDLGQKIQEGWVAGAEAVAQSYLGSKEETDVPQS